MYLSVSTADDTSKITIEDGEYSYKISKYNTALIYRSVDFGKSWKKISEINPDLFFYYSGNVEFFNDTGYFLINCYDTTNKSFPSQMYKTINDGGTWNLLDKSIIDIGGDTLLVNGYWFIK